MQTRKTVSLFLYIPEKRVIVLGVRANTQTHPHLLQATAHGTIEKGEDHADAIERELREETGLELPDIGSPTFLGELDAAGHKVREDCNYYLASLTPENAKKLRPTAEVGHFRFVEKGALREIVVFSEAEKKKLDVAVHSIMFNDEFEALEEAFALLEEHKWNPVSSG